MKKIDACSATPRNITLTDEDLVPGRKVRALAKEVRRFVLDLGDVTDLYFYKGISYVVRWKSCGLGMAEIWLEEKK